MIQSQRLLSNAYARYPLAARALVARQAIVNRECATTITMADEEELGFSRLGQDELVLVWKQIADDDRFAAALSCKKFHEAGLHCGKKWHPGKPKKVLTVTRVLATLRSASLQAWAAAVGCPSHYPHWVEIHGLSGAPQYNGRVGRAMGPPNAQGRVQVEVDAGLGELPLRGRPTSSKSLKSLLVKPSNLRALVSLSDDLVHAVYSESGGVNGTCWKEVVIPRKHSCFERDVHLSQLRCQSLTATLSPLLHKCGELLTIQRVERPHSRERASMDNQLATYLMIDTESGFAPPEWQSGIGDVYLYRAGGPPGPPLAATDFTAQPVHLTLDEVGFMWDWINGELGSGEDVKLATAGLYQKRMQQYLETNANGKDHEEYMEQLEDLKAKLASGELRSSPSGILS